EVHERPEERLLAMDRVVALGEIAIDVDQLQPGELPSAFLVPREDRAGEQALDAVGLDQDEGAFVHESSWDGWSMTGSVVVPGSPGANSCPAGSSPAFVASLARNPLAAAA